MIVFRDWHSSDELSDIQLIRVWSSNIRYRTGQGVRVSDRIGLTMAVSDNRTVDVDCWVVSTGWSNVQPGSLWEQVKPMK